MYENAREEDLALLFRVLNEHLTDEQEVMDEVTLQNYGKGEEVR